LPIYLDDSFIHKDGFNRADFVKHLHAKVKEQIERKNYHYARIANKKRKEVIFEPRDSI